MLDEPDTTPDELSYLPWEEFDSDPSDLWNGPVEDWESAKAAATLPSAPVPPASLPPAPVPHTPLPPAPPLAPLPPYQRGLGIRRPGPLGTLASLLSLPAALAGLYLAVTLWGEDRETAWRVLGAMALYALSPVLVGLVMVPLSLVIGFALQGSSDEARGRFGVVWRSLFDGLANLVSLAALVFILARLWEAVAS